MSKNDKFFLFMAILAVTPVVIIGLVYLAIAYPAHLITASIFSKTRQAGKR